MLSYAELRLGEGRSSKYSMCHHHITIGRDKGRIELLILLRWHVAWAVDSGKFDVRALHQGTNCWT